MNNFGSGCQLLDRLENNSRTVKGAQLIGQDNEALANVLLPLKGWSKGSQDASRSIELHALLYAVILHQIKVFTRFDCFANAGVKTFYVQISHLEFYQI